MADLIGWSLSIAVALATIYGPWHVFRPDNPYLMSDMENVLYGTLHRFAFVFCVGWVIYSAIIKKVVSFICFSLDFSTGYQRIRKNILTARTKLLKSGSCESFRTAAKRYEIFPIIFFFFLTLNYTVLKE